MTGTMMLGHVDTLFKRVEHLVAMRDSQDRAHGALVPENGYRAFIPWTYQPDNTNLGRSVPGRTSSEDYLRTLAVSRLVFDGVNHV
jgi:cyclic dehypoxanthinyl futalosine synthase